VSGEAHGTVTYAWMEGGFFLIQQVDPGQAKGMEIIGRERGYGATEPSKDIKSRYYGSDGSTLDYVYELEGDTLMIWFGEQGSPAYYQGSFSDDGDTLTGAWVYPGGGGYSTTTTSTAGSRRWANHAGIPHRRVLVRARSVTLRRHRGTSGHEWSAGVKRNPRSPALRLTQQG
jgi:hypothetical protein